MIASLRAWRASSGVISGLGLASANTIGRLAMPLSISPVTIPPTDSPTNTSASFKASARVRGIVTREMRSEEHTSELQSHSDLVCRLLLEKKKKKKISIKQLAQSM